MGRNSYRPPVVNLKGSRIIELIHPSQNQEKTGRLCEHEGYLNVFNCANLRCFWSSIIRIPQQHFVILCRFFESLSWSTSADSEGPRFRNTGFPCLTWKPRRWQLKQRVSITWRGCKRWAKVTLGYTLEKEDSYTAQTIDNARAIWSWECCTPIPKQTKKGNSKLRSHRITSSPWNFEVFLVLGEAVVDASLCLKTHLSDATLNLTLHFCKSSCFFGPCLVLGWTFCTILSSYLDISNGSSTRS